MTTTTIGRAMIDVDLAQEHYPSIRLKIIRNQFDTIYKNWLFIFQYNI